MDPFEDVFPIEDGDLPASYVGLPEGGNQLDVPRHLPWNLWSPRRWSYFYDAWNGTSCYYVGGKPHITWFENMFCYYKHHYSDDYFILRYFFGLSLKVFGVIANSPISIFVVWQNPWVSPFDWNSARWELPVEQSQHHAISISIHPFWVRFVHTGLFNHSADAEVEDGRMLMQRLWMRKRRTYLEIIATNIQSWHGMVEVWNPKTTETTGIIYLSNTFTKKRWNHCFLPKSQSSNVNESSFPGLCGGSWWWTSMVSIGA